MTTDEEKRCAEQRARWHAALYPDPATKRWVYRKALLAYYRAQEQARREESQVRERAREEFRK